MDPPPPQVPRTGRRRGGHEGELHRFGGGHRASERGDRREPHAPGVSPAPTWPSRAPWGRRPLLRTAAVRPPARIVSRAESPPRVRGSRPSRSSVRKQGATPPWKAPTAPARPARGFGRAPPRGEPAKGFGPEPPTAEVSRAAPPRGTWRGWVGVRGGVRVVLGRREHIGCVEDRGRASRSTASWGAGFEARAGASRSLRFPGAGSRRARGRHERESLVAAGGRARLGPAPNATPDLGSRGRNPARPRRLLDRGGSPLRSRLLRYAGSPAGRLGG